jgi:hypothetical protein
MAKRSIRHLLPGKGPEKKTLSPEMRNLLGSWHSTATVIRKTGTDHR